MKQLSREYAYLRLSCFLEVLKDPVVAKNLRSSVIMKADSYLKEVFPDHENFTKDDEFFKLFQWSATGEAQDVFSSYSKLFNDQWIIERKKLDMSIF